MEEMDFSPLHATIDEQALRISRLEEELADYKASFTVIEREKEDLEDKVTELETELSERTEALEQIANVVSRHV